MIVAKLRCYVIWRIPRDFKVNQLVERSIVCPYCAESIDVLIDSTDLNQQYIEDCQVCCKPIVFLISESKEGDHVVSVYNEDEAF